MGILKHPLVIRVIITIWICAVTTGLAVFWNYNNTPGAASTGIAKWPLNSSLKRDDNLPTLVVLLHPKCSCSRASLSELAQIMTYLKDRAVVYALFIRPEGVDVNWEQTELWQQAANIPGVKVLTDLKGQEAHLFQAKTSGQTLLFNASGRLIFSGGITGSRGHSGDNIGRSSIISLVREGSSERDHTFVFGCPLAASSECTKENGVCSDNHQLRP